MAAKLVEAAMWNIYTWPPHVAWASSNHGSWVPWVSIPKESEDQAEATSPLISLLQELPSVTFTAFDCSWQLPSSTQFQAEGTRKCHHHIGRMAHGMGLESNLLQFAFWPRSFTSLARAKHTHFSPENFKSDYKIRSKSRTFTHESDSGTDEVPQTHVLKYSPLCTFLSVLRPVDQRQAIYPWRIQHSMVELTQSNCYSWSLLIKVGQRRPV